MDYNLSAKEIKFCSEEWNKNVFVVRITSLENLMNIIYENNFKQFLFYVRYGENNYFIRRSNKEDGGLYMGIKGGNLYKPNNENYFLLETGTEYDIIDFECMCGFCHMSDKIYTNNTSEVCDNKFFPEEIKLVGLWCPDLKEFLKHDNKPAKQ